MSLYLSVKFIDQFQRILERKIEISEITEVVLNLQLIINYKFSEIVVRKVYWTL